MPDLDEYRISELDSVASLNNGDLIEVAGVDAQTETGYRSVKVPMTQLGDKLLNGIDYVTDLQTTSKKVFGAINEVKTSIDNLPKPIVLKGTLGTGGTISTLPVDGSADIGDMYIVSTAGTYDGHVCDLGDTVICLTKTLSANTWVRIPSGDEPSGTVTSVKIEATSPIVVDDDSAITTSGVRILSHADSGATAGSYGDSTAQTPAYGATFKVPYITVDAKGHITSISEHTVKIPDSDNTTYSLTQDGTDGHKITLTPSSGTAQSITVPYAEKTEEFAESTRTIGNKIPYNYRPTNGGYVSDIGDRETDMLVGGTIAFNQLVQTTDTSVTVTSGHKYLSKINNVQTVAISNGTAISIDDGTKDNVHDLTAMFGTTIADYIYTLESNNAGAGVAYFRKLFPKPYYAYNAGELMSVKTSAHKMVGFNAWDEIAELGTINDTTGQNDSDNTRLRSKNYIPCLPNVTYYVKKGGSGNIGFFYYDANKNFISSIGWLTGNTTLSIPENTYFIRFILATQYGTTYNHDICINISWDGERNGEYEPYEVNTYPLDSDLELRGIPKLDANNNLYYDGDTYESDGTVTRYFGIRAYQSGDESLTDAITDGTNTVYKLTTPTTEQADAYQNPQIANDFGTEEYVDNRAVAIPVGHETEYFHYNDREKLDSLPDSANTDGDFIIKQTEGKQELVTPTASSITYDNGTSGLSATNVKSAIDELATEKTEINDTTASASTTYSSNKIVSIIVPIQDNAGYHNSIYRGKYLGSEVTAAQWSAISAGTFDDLFIGDYWTIGSVNWRIAHFNYWLNCGDTNTTAPHVVIVPDTNLYSYVMNDTNITTGGYFNSKMRGGITETETFTGDGTTTKFTVTKTPSITTSVKINGTATSAYTLSGKVYTFTTAPAQDATIEIIYVNVDYLNQGGLAQAKTTIEAAFGSSHILSHRVFLTTATNSSGGSNWAWQTSSIDLMSEVMVYGIKVWANSGYEVGVEKEQLALFRLDHSRITNRSRWWLRSANSAANFAYVVYHGVADYGNASYSIGVRPAFAIF